MKPKAITGSDNLLTNVSNTCSLFYIQFHQSLEDKKENIVKLKTELAWSMAKQAEVEFSKASKEIEQQEQKIIKANDYIEKELKQQQNLKNEKLEVEKDVQELAKKSDNFEYVLNGCKENLRLAREGKLGFRISSNCFYDNASAEKNVDGLHFRDP